MIAANDITKPQAGFGMDTNQVTLFFVDGSFEELPLMSKDEVAEKIIQHLVSWLAEGAGYRLCAFWCSQTFIQI